MVGLMMSMFRLGLGVVTTVTFAEISWFSNVSVGWFSTDMRRSSPGRAF